MSEMFGLSWDEALHIIAAHANDLAPEQQLAAAWEQYRTHVTERAPSHERPALFVPLDKAAVVSNLQGLEETTFFEYPLDNLGHFVSQLRLCYALLLGENPEFPDPMRAICTPWPFEPSWAEESGSGTFVRAHLVAAEGEADAIFRTPVMALGAYANLAPALLESLTWREALDDPAGIEIVRPGLHLRCERNEYVTALLRRLERLMRPIDREELVFHPGPGETYPRNWFADLLGQILPS